MLSINLLPEALQTGARSPWQQCYRIPLVWIVGGALALGVAVSWVPVAVRRHQLQQVRAKMQALEPRKAAVEQLQKSVQHLRAQEAAFRGVGGGQGLGHWAKRLNVLSDLTPGGVWFTALHVDQATGLVLEGMALAQGGAEMASIGRIAQEVRTHPEFSPLFSDVQIGSITRAMDHDVELIHFTLTATLAEAEAPPKAR